MIRYRLFKEAKYNQKHISSSAVQHPLLDDAFLIQCNGGICHNNHA